MDTQNSPPRVRRKHRSLAQELVTELSQRIRDGVIKRGDKLPTESAIMEEQGVSRTVVREALSRLQAAGLVETRHGIGTFVLDTPSPSGFRIDPATIVTLRDVLAILELRISLEVESAGLAAQRRSAEQLTAMREALDVLSQSATHSGDAVASDFQFHLLIAEACGNVALASTVQHLWTLSENSAIFNKLNQHFVYGEVWEVAHNEHLPLLRALKKRQPAAARRAMRDHLLRASDLYQTVPQPAGI